MTQKNCKHDLTLFRIEHLGGIDEVIADEHFVEGVAPTRTGVFKLNDVVVGIYHLMSSLKGVVLDPENPRFGRRRKKGDSSE